MLEIIMRFMFLGHHQKRGFSLSRMFEALLAFVPLPPPFFVLSWITKQKMIDREKKNRKTKEIGGLIWGLNYHGLNKTEENIEEVALPEGVWQKRCFQCFFRFNLTQKTTAYEDIYHLLLPDKRCNTQRPTFRADRNPSMPIDVFCWPSGDSRGALFLQQQMDKHLKRYH